MQIRKPHIKIFLPNRIIWYLTASDSFAWGAYSAILALIGLFLAKKFDEDVESLVGIGLGIYLVSRSASQIFIAQISDKLPSLRDEIKFMVLGGILMGGSIMFYPFITSATQYYLLQGVVGIGVSMNLIGWRKIFAKNLDENNEGMDYGVYDSVYSLVAALFSVTAGIIANISSFHFEMVMLISGGLVMLSGIWPMMISIELKKIHKLDPETVLE